MAENIISKIKIKDIDYDLRAIKAIQDNAGNIINSTYETKTDASTKLSAHNTSTSAHNDIRDLINGLTSRLNALADSDDITLDQMSEIVAYIKSNKSLIDSVTTSKINVSDIIDNLTTNVSNKPLSASQGVALKSLIDSLQTTVDGKASTSDLTSHTNNKSNPHGVTASQVGAPTVEEMNAAIAAVPAPDMSSKQDKITGTPGDFVVIGSDGAVTTKTIANAEEASF